MLDFSNIPFYDNHTHQLNMQKEVYTPLEFALNYLHGFRDGLPEPDGQPGVSPELEASLAQFGVVKTMVHFMAQRFGCAATLEAVCEARNRRVRQIGIAAYNAELFEEANVFGCTVDEPWPVGDVREKMFPGRIQRLFQMDPLFDRLFAGCGTYSELKEKYVQAVSAALEQGYIGIKCHVGERHSFAVKAVSDKDAEASYASALIGDGRARDNVYFAIFASTLQLCMRYNVPIHIHTGSTGGSGDGYITNCDPLLICPFLNDPAYHRCKIVFLHGNHPDVGHAALMTQMYPHAWLDLSWMLPWVALDVTRILRVAIGLAPHDKIMLGTGQHGIPEMVWVAAKAARIGLGTVMNEYVEQGLLSSAQAQQTAEMILYRNAARLYGLQ